MHRGARLMKYNFTRRAGTGINSFGTHVSKRPAFACTMDTSMRRMPFVKFMRARECEFSDSHYADGTARRVQKNAVQLIHTPLLANSFARQLPARETTRALFAPVSLLGIFPN